MLETPRAAAVPTLAELREVCQPGAKLRSRNGEHWAGRLYMRRISLRLTRRLVRTRVTPDALTWSMVVCGVASGPALLVPGPAGAVAAALLFQLFLLTKRHGLGRRVSPRSGGWPRR
ncbi:hypothetical protein OG417_37490 [Actinoallomurus sp. NBC_01490]|uniref:hypothetical protein n=1 Tax=Actinoallomurus sp. NBC_01490 TaxID=2903557 RepID=UPI002E2ED59A|nr:hypothetical protein [Actinoallomurus sp. NBC_01490]